MTSKGFTTALQDALTKAGADVASMKGNQSASKKEAVEETYDIAVVGAGASGQVQWQVPVQLLREARWKKNQV